MSRQNDKNQFVEKNPWSQLSPDLEDKSRLTGHRGHWLIDLGNGFDVCE